MKNTNNITQIDKLVYSPSETSRILGFKLMKQKDPELYGRWKNLQAWFYDHVELETLANLDMLRVTQYDPIIKHYNNPLSVVCNNINQNIGLLKNLTILKLYKLKANTIPESILNLTNLTNLSIQESKIHYIPKNIKNLTNLENLNLNGNLITKIPKEITKLTKLKYLYLGENKLTEIPPFMSEFKNLYNFVAFVNKLKEFPIALTKIKSLRECYIHLNDINTIPIEDLKQSNIKTLGFTVSNLSKSDQAIIKKGIGDIDIMF